MTISTNSLAIRRLKKKMWMCSVRFFVVDVYFTAVAFFGTLLTDLASKIITAKDYVFQLCIFRTLFNYVSFGFLTTLPIRAIFASLASKAGMVIKGQAFIPSCLFAFCAFVPGLVFALTASETVALPRAISGFNTIDPLSNGFLFTAKCTYKSQRHIDNIPYLAASSNRKQGELQEYLYETICSQARMGTFGKVQRLRAESRPDSNARTSALLHNGDDIVRACRRLQEPEIKCFWDNKLKYGDPERLFSGEVGRIESVRIIRETNYLSNARGGSTLGEAVMFGADAVMEAVALPEEVRSKIPTDYGRSRGIAWYGILGFAKIWDYTGDSETHIIHINSV